MKAIIFDSGALINLSMNGLLDILEKLKKEFEGKFIITKDVKYETIDRPEGIPKFELGALRIEDLLNRKIIELPSSIGISDKEIEEKTEELKNIANKLINVEGKFVEIVSKGEMSCVALSNILREKEIENFIAIDERTTRIIGENPRQLERIMSNKLHKKVELNNVNLKVFSECKFIRSAEIVYLAYKKGIIEIKGKKVLEALLYALKFKGCSITEEEIKKIKEMERKN